MAVAPAEYPVPVLNRKNSASVGWADSKTSRGASRGAPHVSYGSSVGQRATGLSAASFLSTRSKPKRPPKELTFKQQLLKKTLAESVMRPSGIMALHIKQGHFHNIDPGGNFILLF